MEKVLLNEEFHEAQKSTHNFEHSLEFCIATMIEMVDSYFVRYLTELTKYTHEMRRLNLFV